MHRESNISPCFGKGSGLKQLKQVIGLAPKISPCFGKGSGLKHFSPLGCSVTSWPLDISPCFGKGSGLKQRH